MVGSAVAFFGAMALVYFIGFLEPVDGPPEDDGVDDQELRAEERALYAEKVSAAPGSVTIASPMAGLVLPLAEVPDKVFSTAVMGQGVAIDPSGNQVVAPFDGTVVTTLPSAHAVGLRSDDGVELLIHVGLDTVELAGKPFTLHVGAGDRVRRGDLLLEFDKEAIVKAGYSALTPIVVTNTRSYAGVLGYPRAKVAAGEELATVLANVVQDADGAKDEVASE